jgi:hypothetical protein
MEEQVEIGLMPAATMTARDHDQIIWIRSSGLRNSALTSGSGDGVADRGMGERSSALLKVGVIADALSRSMTKFSGKVPVMTAIVRQAGPSLFVGRLKWQRKL